MRLLTTAVVICTTMYYINNYSSILQFNRLYTLFPIDFLVLLATHVHRRIPFDFILPNHDCGSMSVNPVQYLPDLLRVR